MATKKRKTTKRRSLKRKTISRTKAKMTLSGLKKRGLYVDEKGYVRANVDVWMARYDKTGNKLEHTEG